MRASGWRCRNYGIAAARVPPGSRLRRRLRRYLRGSRRRAPAARQSARCRARRADGVLLAYTGLDGRRRETRLRFEPAPTALTAHRAEFDFASRRTSAATVFIVIRFAAGEDVRGAARCVLFAHSVRRAGRCRATASRAAAISTSNERVQRDIRRSVADLYMLVTDTRTASIPTPACPGSAPSSAATADHRAADPVVRPENRAGRASLSCERPGDRARSRTRCRAGQDPARSRGSGRWPTCARCRSAATTAASTRRRLFIMLAGAYLERTGDVAALRELWPAVEAAARAGSTPTATATATASSSTAGKPATASSTRAGRTPTTPYSTPTAGSRTAPIALVEVQAYVYGAWRAAAMIARRLKRRPEEVASFNRRAPTSASASIARSGTTRSEATLWRSTARSGLAGFARPTPVMRC